VVTGLGILLLVLLLPLQQATQITNQGITTVVPKPEPSSSNSNSNSSSQQAQAQAQTPKGSPYGLAKKYVITQEYGCTSWTIEERVSLSECSTGRKHQGIDLAGLVSFGPLYATMRGKVIAAGMMNDGYGIRVELENSEYRIRYAHLSVVSVRMGQIVEVGQELGQEGTTGASTGPHLHYQIWKQDKIVDPRPYLP